MIGWLEQLWDTMTAVSLPLLPLGIGFQTAQTLLVALAWRNILRSAYPGGDVRYRPVLSYYAGGTGLNAILPASAGTVTMIGYTTTAMTAKKMFSTIIAPMMPATSRRRRSPRPWRCFRAGSAPRRASRRSCFGMSRRRAPSPRTRSVRP